MKATTITGTITLSDGTTSQFSITAGIGWRQWGATTERLGESVDALEAMVKGLSEDDLLEPDTDDDAPRVERVWYSIEDMQAELNKHPNW